MSTLDTLQLVNSGFSKWCRDPKVICDQGWIGSWVPKQDLKKELVLSSVTRGQEITSKHRIQTGCDSGNGEAEPSVKMRS